MEFCEICDNLLHLTLEDDKLHHQCQTTADCCAGWACEAPQPGTTGPNCCGGCTYANSTDETKNETSAADLIV